MTARPGIIMPAVLFASRADRERAVTVMGAIITYRVRERQIRSAVAIVWQSALFCRRFRGGGDAFCSKRSLGSGAAYSLDMVDLSFADDKTASRFTLHRGDDLVSVLDYRDDGRTIALTRAFTIPTFRGHGYAAVITERAVDAIEAVGDREIIPVCWYVGEWFDAHPERAGVLQARRTS